MDVTPDTTAVRGFWDWAFKRSPKAARFLFVGFLVLAVAAIVMAWRVSIGSLAVTALLVLVAAVVVTLVLKEISRSKPSVIAAFLLWSLVVLVVAVLTLFVAAAFFGTPSKGSILVARVFNLPELLASGGDASDRPISPVNGGWPAAATTPLDVDGDRFARLDALKHRPSVRLSADEAIKGGGTVFVNTLFLKGDVAVTAGQDLTIEALKVVSEGARLRSFDSLGAAAGAPTVPGGKVTLIVHDRVIGKLTIDLSGRPGRDGGKGADGGPGRQGAQGDNAASGLFDCKHGPGRGGDGGTGQSGADGTPGLDGGAGGVLIVGGNDPEEVMREIVFTSRGGTGGRGGPGGKGGDGGPPGPGGSSSGLCSGTGPSGSGGPRGADGRTGRDGNPGADGSVVLRKLGAGGTLP